MKAGEDLEEDEDEDKDEDDLPIPVPSASALEAGHQIAVSERTPLIQRTMTRSKRRRMSVGPTGDATVTQAVLMVCQMLRNNRYLSLTLFQLLKGFVGTGVLFLGKAYVLFSP